MGLREAKSSLQEGRLKLNLIKIMYKNCKFFYGTIAIATNVSVASILASEL